MADALSLCSKPVRVAGRIIRNDGDCCNPVHAVYEGMPLCRFHFLRIKAREECSICLSSMRDSSKRVMLPCCHFFHLDCLAQCREPLCPICRQQIDPKDAARIFTPTVFRPLIEQIYALPSDRIRNVMNCFQTLVRMAQRENSQIVPFVNDMAAYFGRAHNVAETMVDVDVIEEAVGAMTLNEDEETHGARGREEMQVDRSAIINDMMRNMVDLLRDANNSI